MEVPQKALSVRNLAKTYTNGVEALRGVDLEVEPGEFFGLLGPNGAGKSTLIGIVTSLVNKTGGRVEIFGRDLERDPVGAKRLLGVVPQEVNFNQFERPDQIVAQQAGYYGMGFGQAHKRAEQCLRDMELWDKRTEPSRSLSGGMKRRLMIARALVHQPRLLILDEPTAGVDIELRRTTWRLLEEINRQGTTVILTTHYLEEAEQLCRRIAIIDHGEIIENTDRKTLLSKLSVETFVLDPAQPVDRAPNLGPFPTRLRDDGSLEVEVERSYDMNRLFVELERQGLTITSLRNKANRLEELFLRLLDESTAAKTESGTLPDQPSGDDARLVAP